MKDPKYKKVNNKKWGGLCRFMFFWKEKICAVTTNTKNYKKQEYFDYVWSGPPFKGNLFSLAQALPKLKDDRYKLIAKRITGAIEEKEFKVAIKNADKQLKLVLMTYKRCKRKNDKYYAKARDPKSFYV